MRVSSEKHKHPASTTFRESNPYESLYIVEIRLEQNIFPTCTVGGAERLISKQIYRSGYSYKRE